MNKEEILHISDQFWDAMEHADGEGMRKIAHPECQFVHIGITCGLEKEIAFYEEKTFQPTHVEIHKKDCKIYENTAVVITDCEYSLLLEGKETTHHFAVSEVYDASCKLVQFSFTALVY